MKVMLESKYKLLFRFLCRFLRVEMFRALASSLVFNFDGAMFENFQNKKFQWQQNDVNCYIVT